MASPGFFNRSGSQTAHIGTYGRHGWSGETAHIACGFRWSLQRFGGFV
jgi:hypothetical protein